MTARSLMLIAVILCCLCVSKAALAGSDNTFSGAVFLGDSYAPNNFRLSFGSFDLGLSDISDLYAGSRVWQGDYYAGFGLGSQGSVYGLVGYEWKWLSWLGMNFEFDGSMSAAGQAAGRVYIGLVAGW